jgi:glutathione peroxidase
MFHTGHAWESHCLPDAFLCILIIMVSFRNGPVVKGLKSGIALALVLFVSIVGTEAAGAGASVYDFTVDDIDGTPRSLSAYKGKVVLIVNVASKCGYTYQYEGLETLYKTYKDRGLVILGFPSNDFLGQEPGSDQEIKDFCTLTYGVSFPMFSKLTLKGGKAHPLYKYLTSKETNGKYAGAITWNFNKFLIGRDGATVARFGSKDEPTSSSMIAAVEAALGK